MSETGTKTMTKMAIGCQTKVDLKKFVEIHGISQMIDKVDFVSFNTRLIEEMFDEYNRLQQIPSVLEYKYKTSRLQ